MKNKMIAIIICTLICASLTACIQDNLEKEPSIPERTVVSAYDEKSEPAIEESSTTSNVQSDDESSNTSVISGVSENSETSAETSEESKKTERKAVSEKSTVQNSIQSSDSGNKHPNITYEISSNNTDNSKSSAEYSNISAEVSGSSGKNVYGISVEIEDNDPHKNEKIKIIEYVKDILSKDQYRYENGGSFYMNLKLDEALQKDGIDFSVDSVGMIGLVGTFGDGTEWELDLNQVYKDDKLKKRFKISANESENQQLNKVLKAVKRVIAQHKDENPLKNETISAVSDAVFELIMEDLDMMPVQVWYDGIGGTFADGTDWGYDYEELK